jgi:hypothetical protein
MSATIDGAPRAIPSADQFPALQQLAFETAYNMGGGVAATVFDPDRLDKKRTVYVTRGP